MDEVIVSDQGSVDDILDEVTAVCKKYGATLVSTEYDADAPWSIAKARNVGLQASDGTGEWVFCVDADIVVPPGFLQALKDHIAKNPSQGVAPIVTEMGRHLKTSEVYGTGWEEEQTFGERIGSGLSALPVGLVKEVHGWDEKYVGYGSEDIDLLVRLDRTRGFRTEAWQDGPRLYHQPHEEDHWRGKENLARSVARMQGELGWEVNTKGWGEGGVVLVRRGAEE
jgi:glycosyltransferase involved in cell wall biosynthesis